MTYDRKVIRASDLPVGTVVALKTCVPNTGKVISNSLTDKTQVAVEWDSGIVSNVYANSLRFGLDLEFALKQTLLVKEKILAAQTLLYEARSIANDANL